MWLPRTFASLNVDIWFFFIGGAPCSLPPCISWFFSSSIFFSSFYWWSTLLPPCLGIGLSWFFFSNFLNFFIFFSIGGAPCSLLACLGIGLSWCRRLSLEAETNQSWEHQLAEKYFQMSWLNHWYSISSSDSNLKQKFTGTDTTFLPVCHKKW